MMTCWDVSVYYARSGNYKRHGLKVVVLDVHAETRDDAKRQGETTVLADPPARFVRVERVTARKHAYWHEPGEELD